MMPFLRQRAFLYKIVVNVGTQTRMLGIPFCNNKSSVVPTNDNCHNVGT